MMAEMNTTLAHGGDDVTFERVLIGGRPHWRFSCGTLLPVISGGATEGGDGGEGGEGGDGGTGDGSGGEGSEGSGQGAGGDAGGEGAPPAKVEYSPEQQAHMAEVIKQEKAKAAAAATKAAEEAAKQAAERAKMDEAERLKAEKADAEKKASDAVAAANARVVNAEAKVQAVEAGADPKQLAYVLKLADLDGITVDDAGQPDGKAIKAAIDKVLKDVPALKATAGDGKGGGKSGGQFDQHADRDRPKTLEDAVSARLAG